MNAPARTNQSQSSPVDRRPLTLLLLLVGILTARWIWIAGLGDYAWNYELGMRVLQGEVPYRDFISTLPQLTSYTIVPLLAALQGSVWAFHLHLYLWWLATLLVGLQIARRLGLRPAAQAGAMFLATCLSLPAIHLGHAYSYAGTFFFGLALLQLFEHRKQAALKPLFCAGAFAGLGILAKQNIGMMTVILGLGVMTYDCVMNHQTHLVLRRAFVFGLGTTATFLPIFAYFASQAGAGEVFHQMFSDASAGKGGMIGMIFHVLPLIFFTPETPLRQLWTLVVSGGVALIFFGLVGGQMYRLQKSPPINERHQAPRDFWKLILCAIGIVACLAAISLVDLPLIRSWCNKLHPAAIYEFHGFVAPLVFVAYSFFTALAAVCLLSAEHWRKPNLFLPIWGLPLILWGHEISCEGYLPFGAPVVVPLAFVLLEKIGLVRNTVPLAGIAGTMVMLGLAGSTQDSFQPPCFKSVAPLPPNTKFAGLYARPEFVTNTKELNEIVTPKIQDQTTLWLCVGGPHLAFGGKSVFSVAALFGDTYNLRSEPILFAHWQAQPPRFVFVGNRNYCHGSRLFTTEALNSWLPHQYDPVWKSSHRDATLWQLRSFTNNPTR